MKWGCAYRMLFTCILLVQALFFDTVHAQNCLCTIFHHHIKSKGSVQNENRVPLELGKLILSFEGDPELEVHTGRAREGSSLVERTFFCQHALIKSEACAKMVHDVLKNKSAFYDLDISQIHSPMPGIRITFFYDRAAVGVLYEVLDVGHKKRLIFTFYNKEKRKALAQGQEESSNDLNAQRRGIIIDFGHGGADLGAVSTTGICEKEVNHSVGLCLANLLQKRGFDVFLTRNGDSTRALDERTCLTDANMHANLFVSVHTNAAPNVQASGIETLYFDVHSFPETDQRSRARGQLMHERSYKSNMLAQCIQQSVLEYVRTKYKDTVDRKVKHAFLQVLIGAAIPAAVVEVGFLTNSNDELLLQDPSYHMLLAMGICEGIVRYFEQIPD